MAFEMPAPLNYMLNVPDPTEAVRKNLELAVGVRNSQQQAQLHQLQAQELQQRLTQQQIAQQRQQSLNADIATMGANPTTQGIALLSAKYPELKDHFKASFDMLSAKEKDADVRRGQEVYNAINTNSLDVAKKVTADNAAAFRNSNMPERADAMDKILKQLDDNPAGAKLGIGLFLSHAMGSAEFEKALTTPAELRAKNAAATTAEVGATHAEEKAQTDMAGTRASTQSSLASAGSSDASAASTRQATAQSALTNPYLLAKDAAEATKAKAAADDAQIALQYSERLHKTQLLQAQKELGTPNPKVFDATEADAAQIDAARTSALKADNLATRFDSLMNGPGKTGLPGTAAELFKKYAGSQDPVSLLKKLTSQFANKELLSQLPPGGRLSENVLKVFESGRIDPNASKEEVVPLLRGVAVAQRADAAITSVRKKWRELNQSVGAAKVDGDINGVPFKKGEDYNDFVRTKVLPNLNPDPKNVQVLRNFAKHPEVDPAKAKLYQAKLIELGGLGVI